METPPQRQVIIVRHAERMDEVDKGLWRDACIQHRRDRMRRDRCARSDINDPHLTEHGLQQAEEAAVFLQETLTRQGISLDRIYSSRLVRTVQTAHKIALKLKVPIILSSRLAESAAAVAKAKGEFDFLSATELSHFAPGVDLIDDEDEFKISAAAVSHDDELDTLSDYLEQIDISVHNKIEPWESSIHDAVKKHSFSLIVAHRETIRDLAPDHMKHTIPYCGISVFGFTDALPRPRLEFQFCCNRDGSKIASPPDVKQKRLRRGRPDV